MVSCQLSLYQPPSSMSFDPVRPGPRAGRNSAAMILYGNRSVSRRRNSDVGQTASSQNVTASDSTCGASASALLRASAPMG